MDFTQEKQQVISAIDAHQDELWEISRKLYEKPEVAFEEFHAAALLTEMLEKAEFIIEREIAGMKTAFQAKRNGQGDQPVIAFLAEYDALPKLGHACGHNLIATAAIGAGLGMLSVLDRLRGQIQIIGTPAEEKGGGKLLLIKAGIFAGIDAAMIVHPASKNMVFRDSLASMRLCVEFFGRTTHAAASPQEGINALDAVILTFININALRQHLEVKDRVAGIITHGGDAANIIPGYTSAEFSIRGETEARREKVLEKVLACAQAAALATGCSLKHKAKPGYAEIIPNRVIGELFINNMNAIGRQVVEPDPYERMGSTDMGNVSKIVPSLHPYLETVPDEITGHTVEFRELCMSEAGKSTMLDGAKAMAMTAVDLLMHPEYLQRARQELDAILATKG